jgi:diadenosine tetraphosphate (Ap4A) HIT family hydrolase/catechol 2,3-dioxygenase-like lactoylglutathione lyase family enzyme
VADCRICELQQDVQSLPSRERIYIDESWRLSHGWSSLEGWLVLCSIRHVTALDELDPAELDSLGPTVAAATAALRAVVGCERTYLSLFVEQERFRHLHIHIVPRMSWFSEDDSGPRVFHFLNPPRRSSSAPPAATGSPSSCGNTSNTHSDEGDDRGPRGTTAARKARESAHTTPRTEVAMSTTAPAGQGAAPDAATRGVDMRLEVVILPVSDPERSKQFYTGLGWRLDADRSPAPGSRVVQVTPPFSPTSVIFGSGVSSAAPGSIETLVLTVEDIEAARTDLLAHGAEVSEVFHGPGAGFSRDGKHGDPGPDPEGRSYVSFARFSDPDGNGWALQEIKERRPGRQWANEETTSVSRLAELLNETSEHHEHYEKTHEQHNWWDWYAPYLDARLHGDESDAAVAAANRYMDEVKHIAAR